MAREALDLMGDETTPERATALSLSQQHSDAVLMWKALIQQEQNEPAHWTGLARSLEQAGDYETAQKCHAKATSMGATPAPIPEETLSVAPEPEPVNVLGTETAEPLVSEPTTEVLVSEPFKPCPS